VSPEPMGGVQGGRGSERSLPTEDSSFSFLLQHEAKAE
jgi:hypothetical protein